MTGDPLDRIEYEAKHPVAPGLPNVEPSDVLALVEVARAARDLEADVEAITDDGFNLVGHEHILALGAALARLDGAR